MSDVVLSEGEKCSIELWVDLVMRRITPVKYLILAGASEEQIDEYIKDHKGQEQGKK